MGDVCLQRLECLLLHCRQHGKPTPKSSVLFDRGYCGGCVAVFGAHGGLSLHLHLSELAGKVDVGNEVITKVLGGKASLWFGALFALTLLSGINAMYIAGPRISQKMGQDYSIFRGLKNQNQQGAPVAAILLQTLISGLLVVFSNFKDIVEYIGLTLSLFSLLTVAGVFIIRARKWNTDQTVKAWGYPVTPILYIAMTVWMITFFAKEDPMKLLWSLGTVLPALLFYKLSKRD